MFEVYVHSREANSDWRSGTLSNGPCSIKAVLPDGSVFSCDVPDGATVVLEVTELAADAVIAAATAVAAPDPAQKITVDAASGIPTLEPVA